VSLPPLQNAEVVIGLYTLIIVSTSLVGSVAAVTSGDDVTVGIGLLCIFVMIVAVSGLVRAVRSEREAGGPQ